MQEQAVGAVFYKFVKKLWVKATSHRPKATQVWAGLWGFLHCTGTSYGPLVYSALPCFSYTFTNKLWSILCTLYRKKLLTILDLLPAAQFKPVCRKYGWSICDITCSLLKGCCKACPLNQMTRSIVATLNTQAIHKPSVDYRLSVKWQKPSKQVVVEKSRTSSELNGLKYYFWELASHANEYWTYSIWQVVRKKTANRMPMVLCVCLTQAITDDEVFWYTKTMVEVQGKNDSTAMSVIL